MWPTLRWISSSGPSSALASSEIYTFEGSRSDVSGSSSFMCSSSSSSSEQVLHLWLEVLCSSVAAVEKWYHPWSFLRSPGWVQIKCELR